MPYLGSNKGLKIVYNWVARENTGAVNSPYNFLLVYQDHQTKFVVLRPI